MSDLNVKDLKRALIDAGLEVFRVRDDEVHLAERQNVQLMEAGIRVRGGSRPMVTVTARAQRNDSPALTEDTLYVAIRKQLADLMHAGFRETTAAPREIRSVSDNSHIVDVWYEVTFEREVQTVSEAVAEAQRAAKIDRYVVVVR